MSSPAVLYSISQKEELKIRDCSLLHHQRDITRGTDPLVKDLSLWLRKCLILSF